LITIRRAASSTHPSFSGGHARRARIAPIPPGPVSRLSRRPQSPIMDGFGTIRPRLNLPQTSPVPTFHPEGLRLLL
jgi:hypothetical protein